MRLLPKVCIFVLMLAFWSCSGTTASPSLINTAAGAASSIRLGAAAEHRVVERYRLPHQASPGYLAFGPDGRIWFGSPPYIEAMDKDGNVTQYPDPGISAGHITVGKGGLLWIADGYFVESFTTRGATTRYPLPQGDCATGELVVGPDSNIWVADDCANGIDKVTPQGVVTQYLVPTQFPGLSGIIVGDDGNLWFTESTAGKIGRITVTGSITEFAIDRYSVSRELVLGPDHNIYVQARDSGLWQITSQGSITKFSDKPEPSGVVRLIVGPDSNIWMPFSTGQLEEFNLQTHTFSHPFKVTYHLLDAVVGPGRDIWIGGHGYYGIGGFIGAVE